MDRLRLLKIAAAGKTAADAASGGGGGGGSAATGDPHYAKVIAHFDSANTSVASNQNQSFEDTSTNGHTITVSGNPLSSTSSPYYPPKGYRSVFFNNLPRVVVPTSSSHELGSGDFTIECFVNLSSYEWYGTFVSNYNHNSPYNNDAGVYFLRSYQSTDNWQIQFGGGTGFSQSIQSSTALTLRQWHHVAVTRSGTTIKLWQDGVEVGSGTSSVTLVDREITMGTASNGTNEMNGYLSNVRVVKGTALYSSSFNAPTTPLTDVSGTGLLCLQSSTLTDESSNKHTLTTPNFPEITSYYPSQFQLTTKYSNSTHGGSAYFNADYLYIAATSTLSLVNATDFTLELWFYTETDKASRSEHLWGGAVDGSNRESLYFAGNTLTWWVNGSARITTTAWKRYFWNHVAIVNSSGTTTFYLNGTSVGTYTSAYTAGNRYAWIGTYNNNTYTPDGFIGDIANVRMVNGTAVYTTDFTPPTSSLTAITNTSYLPKPIIGFEEQTGKNLELTYNGNAEAISNYHHLQYASYFDGSGDYLSIADDASLELGSSSFTLEMWYKGTDTDQYATLTSTTVAGFTVGHWSLMMNHTNTGDIAFYFGDYSTSGPLLITTTPSVVDNKWHHIALVRDGNSWALYIDGIQRATATSSASSTDDSGGLYIGYDAQYGRDLSGYITDFRLVKGTAVYTSAFTPPKVPLTAISGTSLLISTDQATVQDSSTNSHTVSVNGTVSSTKELNYKDTKTFDIDSSFHFDGVGDYLNVVNNYDYFQLKNLDFTVELWFKRSSVVDASNADSILCSDTPVTAIALAVDPNGYTGFSYSVSAGVWAKRSLVSGDTYGSIQTELEKWYHLAVVRSGSTGYHFVNGVLAETWSFTGTLLDWATGMNLGKLNSNANRYFHGEIFDLRITRGVARYTENFNVPTSKILPNYGSAGSAQAVTLSTDAYFANTVFLQSANTLPANTSVDDNETILDKSTNSLTVTLNGNTKIKPFNPYTPVGEWSIDYSQGNSYSYWTNPSAAIPPQIAWLDGASDSGTFETWVYMTETQASGSNANAAAVSMFQVGLVYMQFSILSTGAVRYYWYTGSQNWIDTTTTLKTHQWHHVALTRDGTDLKIYIDGVLAKSHSSYTGISWASGANGQILYHGFGGNNSEKVFFKGYMSNMRSSDNVRYTGTFNVPTEKFTEDANTLYLSHDNNKRKSRDTNGYEIGDGVAYASTYVRVVSFSPYDSSVPYQNEVGCVEFDGTGDSIDIEAGNHFVTDFGSSDDVTWEGWVYLRASQSSQLWGNTGRTSQVLIHVTNYFYALGFQGTARTFATELYEWHHIAAVRSSGTVYIYVDGVLHDSGAGTGVHNNTSTMRIGERADGYNDMNGYVSDVHWMQGYAKYTSAFTPPTSPVAIHSNTVTKLPFNDLSFFDTTENTGLVSSSTDGALSWPIGRHIKYATWHDKNSTTQHYTVAETASNEFTFGTGDVTMECFYFPYYTTQSSYGAIMTTANSNDSQGPYIGQYNNTNLGLLVGSSGSWAINTTTGSSNKLIMGRWNHIAYAREGNVHRLYCNGEKVLEVTNTVSSTNTNDKLTVGGRTNGSQYAYGWIADVRVVKGTALYTTDYFDVPKEALTEVTNTVFLQSTNSTTLQDSSSNGLSITNSGSVTYVNRKANLKVATTPLIFNGASYVDLTENKSVTGKFGTQDFTIEAYIMRYPLNATYSSWLSTNNGSFASGAKAFRFGSGSANVTNGTGKIHILWQGVGDSWLTSTSTFNDNEWYHFALTREGNTFTMYVNGLREATDTQSGEFNLDIGSGVRLGKSEWDGANGFFSGQISQLRITVGNARYTGAGFLIPDNYFPGKNA